MKNKKDIYINEELHYLVKDRCHKQDTPIYKWVENAIALRLFIESLAKDVPPEKMQDYFKYLMEEEGGSFERFAQDFNDLTNKK